MQIQQQTSQPQHAPYTLFGYKWTVWWKLLRVHTLTASFIPVGIGTMLAMISQPLRLDLFFIMLLSSMLIQVSTNVFNEYYDYKRGLDHEHSLGIGGAIVRHGVSPDIVLTIAKGTMACAILLGLYLASQSSWWLFPIGLCFVAVGYFYSGGPRPISATCFGEIVSGICMGLAIIVISFFLQTGTITITSLIVSIPTSILIGAILMSNNLRDLDDDEKHGRRTLAIIFQRKKATYLLLGMFTFSYCFIIFLIIHHTLSPWSLISFLSIPKAIKASTIFQKNTTPDSLMPGMVATAQTNTLFGLFLIIGLFLQYLSV